MLFFIKLRTICFRENKLIPVDETFVSVGTNYRSRRLIIAAGFHKD